MAARFLLDTNICIYIRTQRPPAVLARFNALERGEAAISVITYGELFYGAEKKDAREKASRQLTELLLSIPVLELPLRAAEAYGVIRANLERRGEIIGANDMWIAAHAQVADLILVTNNEREFRRVPGLKIENWAK